MVLELDLINALRQFAFCAYFFDLLSEIIDTILQILIRNLVEIICILSIVNLRLHLI